MQKLISIGAVLILTGVVHAQHDGHHDGLAAENAEGWIEKRMTVERDSNWNTEHCIHLQGSQKLSYRFDADIPLDMNFHLHPERDGAYHTIYIQRQDDIRTEEGQFDAEEPGAYCFDFAPANRPARDEEIRLHYKVQDPAAAHHNH